MTNLKTDQGLCLALAKAESEEAVISILKDTGHWGDPSVWVEFGNNENNFSTIGNQQSIPESALIEKLINSVDAVLMSACMEKGVHPAEKQKTPPDIRTALEEFFSIRGGKLSSLTSSQRAKLAENIAFVATGSKKTPCYAIVDKGEGQTPGKFSETILSLNKSNKLRIPFVQGKFNMGGTGVLQFCGKNNLQLIVSRRNPNIKKFNDYSDESIDKWGFTIVRRFDPAGEIRSSSYKYLAPARRILSFEAESLPLLPGTYPEAYASPLTWGTYIKLYDYQIQSALRTNILFDLYNRLSLLMPELALPIKLYERRNGYKGHSFEATLTGLSVRIDDDSRDNVEEGFPTAASIGLEDLQLPVKIIAFKKGKSEKYKSQEGIIFSVNGQTHGYIEKIFFSRKNVGMSYLADSILVLVDCSNISGRGREDLFMNSRDRLRKGEIFKIIENELEDLISSHVGLRQLKETRRRELLTSQLSEENSLADVIEELLKKSPALNKIFIEGSRLSNPVRSVDAGPEPVFIPKKYPTYFSLLKEYSPDAPKKAHSNRKFRIQLKTDAPNDYFCRDIDSGAFSLSLNGEEYSRFCINLWNGTVNLNISLPKNAKKGDLINFTYCVSDKTRYEPFDGSFFVTVIDPDNSISEGLGVRKPPSSTKNKGNDKGPGGLALPNITEITEEKWPECGFTKESALLIRDSGGEGYDFLINVDNIHLRLEKSCHKGDTTALVAKYKYGMILIGMALLSGYQSDTEELDDPSERVSIATKYISPFLLPMIELLGQVLED